MYHSLCLNIIPFHIFIMTSSWCASITILSAFVQSLSPIFFYKCFTSYIMLLLFSINELSFKESKWHKKSVIFAHTFTTWGVILCVHQNFHLVSFYFCLRVSLTFLVMLVSVHCIFLLSTWKSLFHLQFWIFFNGIEFLRKKVPCLPFEHFNNDAYLSTGSHSFWWEVCAHS